MTLKHKIIFWLIYLSGFFISYPLGKAVLKGMYPHTYTKSDRLFVIATCTLSWFDVAACGIIIGVQELSKTGDEPAKW